LDFRFWGQVLGLAVVVVEGMADLGEVELGILDFGFWILGQVLGFAIVGVEVMAGFSEGLGVAVALANDLVDFAFGELNRAIA
jgi:hypothetical protein